MSHSAVTTTKTTRVKIAKCRCLEVCLEGKDLKIAEGLVGKKRSQDTETAKSPVSVRQLLPANMAKLHTHEALEPLSHIDMSRLLFSPSFATISKRPKGRTGVLEFGDLHSRTVVSASISGLALHDSGFVADVRLDLIRQFAWRADMAKLPRGFGEYVT
jgi:hypothetical protein